MESVFGSAETAIDTEAIRAKVERGEFSPAGKETDVSQIEERRQV